MITRIKSKITVRVVMMVGLSLLGLNLAGCGSDTTPTDLTAPIVMDTTPPAVPTGLSAAAVDFHVKIGWLPNTTDLDFAGFMVYRLAFGQTWPLLDSPTTETSFLDDSPLNRPCGYAVTAIDQSGNESAWLQVHFQGVPTWPELTEE